MGSLVYSQGREASRCRGRRAGLWQGREVDAGSVEGPPAASDA